MKIILIKRGLNADFKNIKIILRTKNFFGHFLGNLLLSETNENGNF